MRVESNIAKLMGRGTRAAARAAPGSRRPTGPAFDRVTFLRIGSQANEGQRRPAEHPGPAVPVRDERCAGICWNSSRTNGKITGAAAAKQEEEHLVGYAAHARSHSCGAGAPTGGIDGPGAAGFPP